MWLFNETLGSRGLWGWLTNEETGPLSGLKASALYEKVFGSDGLVKWVWDHTLGGLFSWITEKLDLTWPSWDIAGMVQRKFAEVVLAVNSKWDWAVPQSLENWAESVIAQASASLSQGDPDAMQAYGARWHGMGETLASRRETQVTAKQRQEYQETSLSGTLGAIGTNTRDMYGQLQGPLLGGMTSRFAGALDAAQWRNTGANKTGQEVRALRAPPIIILPADAVTSALITPVRDTIAAQAQSYLNNISASNNQATTINVESFSGVDWAIDNGKNNIKQRQHSQRAPSRNQ